METQYFYRIYHGPDTRIRVLMNDVPFYQRAPQALAITHTNGANHLVVPGDNTITLELYEAPTHLPVIVEVTIDNNHDSPVVRLDWPALWEGLPAESAVLPFVFTAPFRAGGVSYKPAYLNAPRSNFGPEGTHELRQAVRDFHDAVSRGDTDAFLRLMELKSSEGMRAYEGASAFSMGAASQEIGAYFAKGPQVRPLDMRDLVFESRLDGRVAYVTRADWGPAIEAATPDGQRFLADLWLTRHDGEWKIFR
ncbi:MAG: nuclear transport factor 2 family protein [Minicystis sp.]